MESREFKSYGEEFAAMSVEQKTRIYDLLVKLSREVKETTSLLTGMTKRLEMEDSRPTTTEEVFITVPHEHPLLDIVDAEAVVGTDAAADCTPHMEEPEVGADEADGDFDILVSVTKSFVNNSTDEVVAVQDASLILGDVLEQQSPKETLAAIPGAQITHITTSKLTSTLPTEEDLVAKPFSIAGTIIDPDAASKCSTKCYSGMLDAVAPVAAYVASSPASSVKGTIDRETSSKLVLTPTCAAVGAVTTMDVHSHSTLGMLTTCSMKFQNLNVNETSAILVCSSSKEFVIDSTSVAALSSTTTMVHNSSTTDMLIMCSMSDLGVYSIGGDTTAAVPLLLGDMFNDVPVPIEVVEIPELKLLVDLKLDNLLPANCSTVCPIYVTVADVLDWQPWPPPQTLEFLLAHSRPKPWPNFITDTVVLVCGFMSHVLLSTETPSQCLQIISVDNLVYKVSKGFVFDPGITIWICSSLLLKASSDSSRYYFRVWMISIDVGCGCKCTAVVFQPFRIISKNLPALATSICVGTALNIIDSVSASNIGVLAVLLAKWITRQAWPPFVQSTKYDSVMVTNSALLRFNSVLWQFKEQHIYTVEFMQFGVVNRETMRNSVDLMFMFAKPNVTLLDMRGLLVQFLETVNDTSLWWDDANTSNCLLLEFNTLIRVRDDLQPKPPWVAWKITPWLSVCEDKKLYNSIGRYDQSTTASWYQDSSICTAVKEIKPSHVVLPIELVNSWLNGVDVPDIRSELACCYKSSSLVILARVKYGGTEPAMNLQMGRWVDCSSVAAAVIFWLVGAMFKLISTVTRALDNQDSEQQGLYVERKLPDMSTIQGEFQFTCALTIRLSVLEVEFNNFKLLRRPLGGKPDLKEGGMSRTGPLVGRWAKPDGIGYKTEKLHAQRHRTEHRTTSLRLPPPASPPFPLLCSPPLYLLPSISTCFFYSFSSSSSL